MEKLRDYFDCSLFNNAISRPLEYEGLLEKTEATKGIDTYSIDESLQSSEISNGILFEGEKHQYWIGRNISIEDNLRDSYNYKVEITEFDDILFLEVNAAIDRYVGSEYWDIINLPTYQISTIPKINGRYHISFEEYYSLKDGVLVHETNLSNHVEVYIIPSEFKLGDSFKECERYVFARKNLQDGIQKVKELKQERGDEQE